MVGFVGSAPAGSSNGIIFHRVPGLNIPLNPCDASSSGTRAGAGTVDPGSTGAT